MLPGLLFCREHGVKRENLEEQLISVSTTPVSSPASRISTPAAFNVAYLHISALMNCRHTQNYVFMWLSQLSTHSEGRGFSQTCSPYICLHPTAFMRTNAKTQLTPIRLTLGDFRQPACFQLHPLLPHLIQLCMSHGSEASRLPRLSSTNHVTPQNELYINEDISAVNRLSDFLFHKK